MVILICLQLIHSVKSILSRKSIICIQPIHSVKSILSRKSMLAPKSKFLVDSQLFVYNQFIVWSQFLVESQSQCLLLSLNSYSKVNHWSHLTYCPRSACSYLISNYSSSEVNAHKVIPTDTHGYMHIHVRIHSHPHTHVYTNTHTFTRAHK